MCEMEHHLLKCHVCYSLVHVLIWFCSHGGLTGSLMQAQQTEYNEVIEKIFSEVSALEDNTKILDGQVDLSMRVTGLTLTVYSV